jgi:hypothetical protein
MPSDPLPLPDILATPSNEADYEAVHAPLIPGVAFNLFNHLASGQSKS